MPLTPHQGSPVPVLPSATLPQSSLLPQLPPPHLTSLCLSVSMDTPAHWLTLLHSHLPSLGLPSSHYDFRGRVSQFQIVPLLCPYLLFVMRSVAGLEKFSRNLPGQREKKISFQEEEAANTNAPRKKITWKRDSQKPGVRGGWGRELGHGDKRPCLEKDFLGNHQNIFGQQCY